MPTFKPNFCYNLFITFHINRDKKWASGQKNKNTTKNSQKQPKIPLKTVFYSKNSHFLYIFLPTFNDQKWAKAHFFWPRPYFFSHFITFFYYFYKLPIFDKNKSGRKKYEKALQSINKP